MDLDTILKIGHESWPLAMLVFLLFVLWRGAVWAERTIITPGLAKMSHFVDKSIAAVDENTQILREIRNDARQEMADVKQLIDMHNDPESSFSTVRLQKDSDRHTANHRAFARAGIMAVETWQRHAPAEDQDTLRRIIEELHKVAGE